MFSEHFIKNIILNTYFDYSRHVFFPEHEIKKHNGKPIKQKTKIKR